MSSHRTLVICLLLSMMLHGIAMVVDHLARPRQLGETRFYVHLIRPHRRKRFSHLPSRGGGKAPRMQRIPSRQMPERITVATDIPVYLPETPDGIVPPPGRTDVLGEGVGERPEEIVLETMSIPSLEEIQVETFRRRLEAARRHRWLQLVDADTTDEESWRRRRARRVVEEAIEAMGGLKALVAIKDMQIRKKIKYWLVIYGMGGEIWEESEPSYLLEAEYDHKRPYKYRERTRRRRTTGYDGEIGWRSEYGTAKQLEGDELLRVKARAERWDFLSQFKGDGILLRYISEEEFTKATYQHFPEPIHIIEVKDTKYGNRQYAVFDRRSRLLTAMVDPPLKSEGSRTLFWRPPPIWVTRYSDYRKVGDILFPHTTRRYNARDISRREHISLGRRWRFGRGGGFRVYEMIYNTGLSDEIFRMPIHHKDTKTP